MAQHERNNNSTNNESTNGYETTSTHIHVQIDQIQRRKTMLFRFRSSASPESGLGTSHTSLHGSGQECTNEISEDMYYEVEPLQPLGICKALYAFDGMK